MKLTNFFNLSNLLILMDVFSFSALEVGPSHSPKKFFFVDEQFRLSLILISDARLGYPQSTM